MPGDSLEFDLYIRLREFLISAKGKEIHDEGLLEPESCEMGLQYHVVFIARRRKKRIFGVLRR